LCNTDKIIVSNSENIENKEFELDQVLHSGIILLTTGVLSAITGNLGTFKIISSKICNVDSIENDDGNGNSGDGGGDSDESGKTDDILSNIFSNNNILIIVVLLLLFLFFRFIV
jgi:hypothetical protein